MDGWYGFWAVMAFLWDAAVAGAFAAIEGKYLAMNIAAIAPLGAQLGNAKEPSLAFSKTLAGSRQSRKKRRKPPSPQPKRREDCYSFYFEACGAAPSFQDALRSSTHDIG